MRSICWRGLEGGAILHTTGGGGLWTDPLGNPEGYAVARVLTEERAEETQLDRDAAARDYVDVRRPREGGG